ncbi:hypothetical protein TRICI_003929 [Trichomonascus ciferrii]|uniref:Cell division control protein 50 n=1 Tax=Trichomonascus ciferrii TaxID=44093 RepID=A0A642V8R6_9ASCO|nr:hypothetical protein TRICI_003929 [Trichomonascus ciferrii]
MDSDSDSDHRPVDDSTRKKSRRPPNTAFRQQRLKAWQPILTPKTVLPLFLCITVIFAPIGGLLLYASNQVQELVIDYSHCQDEGSTEDWNEIPSKYISQSFKGGAKPDYNPTWKLLKDSDRDNYTCSLQFEIPTDMGAPVFMFYRLTNFYQNHRRYVQSFNEDQLNGKDVEASKLKEDCKPLYKDDDTGKPIYPCGLIANSLFNDTFHSPVLLNAQSSSSSNETYKMTDKGIAWSTDKDRFKKTKYKPDEVVPPPNWHEKFPRGYTEDNMPDISEWEALQNWMRTAGLPKFSKLALRNDDDDLKSGRYTVDIGLNFPVLKYDGTKSIVLTTRTVIGGKNPFLGIAYLVVAGLCFVLGIVFLIKHLIKPRKLGDHSYLSWNTEPQQPQQGMATGRESAAAGAQRRF